MKKIVTSLAIIVLLISSVLLLTGCGKENKEQDEKKTTIVGSWKYEGADYTYTFNEDGTGNYNAYGTEMKFTYTTNDNKISILYDGNTSPFETEYSIDGDTLNVLDSFGKDTLYKRVK